MNDQKDYLPTEQPGLQSDPGVTAPTIVAQPPEPTEAKLPEQQTKPFMKRPKVIAFSLLGLVVLPALSFVAYQNIDARNQISTARAAIANQQFDTAKDSLKKAKGFLVFNTTSSEISSVQNEIKKWESSATQVAQAKQLIQAVSYDEAASKLDGIDSKYPAYDEVKSLKQNIRLGQAKANASRNIGVLQEQSTKISATTANGTASSTNSMIPAPGTSTSRTPAPTSSPTFKTSKGKRFADTSVIKNLNAARNIEAALKVLQKFAANYNISVELSYPSAYTNVTYTKLTNIDLASFKKYGAIFIDEWAKYPKDWVASSKVQRIVFVRELRNLQLPSNDHRVSSLPDAYTDSMYYDISYIDKESHVHYVIHHEFDHLITFNNFGSFYPDDQVWKSFNPPGFKYSGSNYANGGWSCYENANNCVLDAHAFQGFASGYGATGIDEDKAEVYAYLLDNEYYHQMINWAKTDTYLAKKINYYKASIAKRSPVMSGSYYDDINPNKPLQL